jgi:hypothetical protein
LSEKRLGLVKGIMNKTEDAKADFKIEMSIYHNTLIHSGGLSPARLFFGQIRLPELPLISDLIDGKLVGQDSRLRRIKEKEKRNTKRTQYGEQPLTLVLGQKVLLQDHKTRLWEVPGIIESIRPGGRSGYI